MTDSISTPPDMQAILELQTMMEEPLHRDLALWTQDGVLGPMLMHPLVYQAPLVAPGLANRQYAEKQRRVAEAEQAQEWSTYIHLHERPYRLWALEQIIDDLPEPTQARLMRSVWIDSENIHQNTESWEDLLTTVGIEMNSAEAQALAALPVDADDCLTVYRGGAVTTDGDALNMGEGAFSWTTQRAQAVWFARRGTYDVDDPTTLLRVVIEGRVRRSDVLAYLLDRHENEVVCLPHTVEQVATTEVIGSHHDHTDAGDRPSHGTRFDPHGSHWWVTCTQGHEHYGEHGAAGLLLRHVDETGTARVMLHRRGTGTDQPGTYGYPGGARLVDEHPEDTARRETSEECGLDGLGEVVDQYVLDHGTWTYTTLIVDVEHRDQATADTWESDSTRWVTAVEAAALPLVDGAAEAINHALNGAPR